MFTLTPDHVIETREPTQETDTDWEQEIVFAHDGHVLAVTVYASTNYGPHSFTYLITDDETGDTVYESRVGGMAPTLPVRVHAAFIQLLAAELFHHTKQFA